MLSSKCNWDDYGMSTWKERLERFAETRIAIVELRYDAAFHYWQLTTSCGYVGASKDIDKLLDMAEEQYKEWVGKPHAFKPVRPED